MDRPTFLPRQQPEISAEDSQRLKAAQVRLMYRMSLFGAAAGTLIALITGAYFWLWHQSTIALAWTLFFLLVGIARAVVYMTYRRADDVDSNPDSWLLAAGFTMLASGLGWGAGAAVFFGLNPVLTTTVVTAMGVSGILMLAPSTRVLAAFNAPLFAGLLFALISAGEPAAWFAVAAIGVLVAALLVHAMHMQAAIEDSMRLSFEKQRVVKALTAARKEVDEAEQRLTAENERRGRVEEELKAARIAAEAANMSKDEFLATMSHEIRTPLNGILPILDILRGTELNHSQQDYLNTAFQSSKHLLRIIDDILDYSKIEAGKLELETVGLNLRELLDSVVRLMSGSAAKKGLELKAVIESGVRLAMRGDPVRMRQVLTNLVSNAIKFTDRGSVTITISKRQDFPSETELLFTVRDTGIGMDRPTAERLFKPFTQADASTTRTYGGTGLGLAICKRLIELMSGKVGVKSQPGKGSIFWFTVRLRKSLGDIQSEQKELASSRGLLISPDLDLRRRFEVFSERWGLRYTAVSKLGDATNRLRNAAELGGTWHFDLVILDLPEENRGALKLAEDLRADARLSQTGILMLTDDGEVPPALRDLDGLAARMRSSSESALREALDTLLAGGGQAASDAVSERELTHATDRLSADRPLEGRVLLVEDNPVNLHVAQKLLDVLGLETEVAKNGKEAMELLTADHRAFDAVLMDCMMPVMDGYTATREWRKHERDQNLARKPIVAMTANAMAGDREKCLEAGMDDYMSKPLNRSLLRDTLAHWIGADEDSDEQRPEVIKAPRRPEPSTREIQSVGAASGVLDRRIIDDLVEMMGADFEQLVSVYLDDSPRALRKLARAVESQQTDDLIGPAHSLKSTSANLGAMGLSEMAGALEQDAREGAAPDAARRVNDMIRIYKQVASELKKVQGQPAG